MKLDYAELSNVIEKRLRKEKEIVLSTCAGGRVTARLMCHINEGLHVLFSTNKNSLKVAQMRENPNIALTAGNLRMEATAELFGHPSGYPAFVRAYAKKFPHLGAAYPETSDDLLVIARPTKISLFQYIGGPCEDILLPGEKTAAREGL